MKKMKLMAFLLGIFFSLNIFAQTATINNVSMFKSSKQAGTIIEKNKVVGYYVFYFKDKVDKANNAYEITVYDDNFVAVKTFEILRPKKSALLETIYNGEAFLFFFYDSKNGFEYLTYDRKGNVLGSKIIAEKDIPNAEVQRILMAQQTETENISFFPMGNKGFIRQTFSKNKKVGFDVIAYDNNMKELWSYASPEDSKMIELIDVNDITPEVLTATITRKKNILTRKVNIAYLILDAKSGKKLAELQMGDEDAGKKSVLKSFIEPTKSSITLVGEFFKPNDDIYKDKSQGMFVQEVKYDGSEINYTEYTWKGDIAAFKQDNLSPEDKKDEGSQYYLFFQNVIRSKNGHLFLIGEQFKKQISAGGLAMNMLSGGSGSGVSNFEIRVGNMVVIELDEKNKLIDYDIVSKRKTSVYLPEGSGMTNSTTLGYYIKSIGGFDYAFTSNDVSNDNFHVVYTDYNRKETSDSKNADKMMGVINVEGGKKTTARVPINSKATTLWVTPAKPGYISIWEYFKKEKKIVTRLEQISY